MSLVKFQRWYSTQFGNTPPEPLILLWQEKPQGITLNESMFLSSPAESIANSDEMKLPEKGIVFLGVWRERGIIIFHSQSNKVYIVDPADFKIVLASFINLGILIEFFTSKQG